MASQKSEALKRNSIVTISDTNSSISMEPQVSGVMAINSNASISETNSSSSTNMDVNIKVEIDPSDVVWKNGEITLKLNRNKLIEIHKKYEEFKSIKTAKRIIEMTPPDSFNSSSTDHSQLHNLTPREYYEIRESRRFICSQDTRLNQSYAFENRPRTKLTRCNLTQDIVPNIPQSKPRQSSPKQKENLVKSRKSDDQKELEETIKRAADRNKSPKERAFAELINNGAEITFESIPSTPEKPLENQCWETADNNWLTPDLSPIFKE